MVELLKLKLGGEVIEGIIPLNAKRLKLFFAGKKFTTSAQAYALMVVVTFSLL